LTEFFEEFGEVESLSMRKDVKKKFKVNIYFRDFISKTYLHTLLTVFSRGILL
jgi:hypothetical protein